MLQSAERLVLLLSAENFFGSAGALPSRKIAVSPFANRHLPIAVFPTCRFADLMTYQQVWLGKSLSLTFPLSLAPCPLSRSRVKARSTGRKL